MYGVDRTRIDRRAVVAVLATLGLTMSACSSGDDDADAPTTTQAAPADESTDESTGDDEPVDPDDEQAAPDESEPADEEPEADDGEADSDEGIPSEDADPDALAARALLTLDNFPDGWTATPNEDDGDDDGGMDQEIEDCIGLPEDAPSKDLDDRDVESPQFDSADESLTVEQSVVIVEDEATAIQIMAELSNPAAPGCIATVFGEFFAQAVADPTQTDFPPGTELGEVVAEAIPVDADPSIVNGIYFEVPISLGDDELVLAFQTWHVRQGRALSQVQFQSIGKPFPSDGISSVLDAVAELLATVG